MIILVVFAFFAGIVTILSPCILPVLPIVLAGSLSGGKRRPFGIITGFIFSFTFFTLFLATLVKATGVSADSLRNISVSIVFLFGVSLLIPQLQVLSERIFSYFSNRVSLQKPGNGYWSGIIIGLSLGLVWTPCVGPILASVITLAVTGSVTGTAFFITLAYSLGTAIPLLAITYGGRQLLQKLPWLLAKSSLIQKLFGIFMMLTAIGIFFNIDRRFQTFILNTFPQYGTGLTVFENTDIVQKQLQYVEKNQSSEELQSKTTQDLINQSLAAAELIPGGEWINSKALTIKQLRGKVVLIDFWTYTCINCIRTLPYLKDWDKKYREKGLVIIGVHTPEFEFEKNIANVIKAVKDFGIEYPVMQDNNYATWQAYDNHYWPAKYFIDKNGKIRLTHFGEGEYDKSEQMIQTLLSEIGQQVTLPINNRQYAVETSTPESYLGYGRIEYSSSPEEIIFDKTSTYSVPTIMPGNTFAYGGAWEIGKEYARPKAGSKLVLKFNAKNVFLVMRPKTSGQSGKLRVILDGKLIDKEAAGEDVKEGTVIVADDKLYSLVGLHQKGVHVLNLEFLDDNLELFAFTFG